MWFGCSETGNGDAISERLTRTDIWKHVPISSPLVSQVGAWICDMHAEIRRSDDVPSIGTFKCTKPTPSQMSNYSVGQISWGQHWGLPRCLILCLLIKSSSRHTHMHADFRYGLYLTGNPNRFSDPTSSCSQRQSFLWWVKLPLPKHLPFLLLLSITAATSVITTTATKVVSTNFSVSLLVLPSCN